MRSRRPPTSSSRASSHRIVAGREWGGSPPLFLRGSVIRKAPVPMSKGHISTGQAPE
ncbi:hypothetical protein BQ8420_13500 [Nocardiopsis sp. JB363]|nr:hypothetical protein BQ8420_13500 [Nocardiopsis sp. JB363]